MLPGLLCPAASGPDGGECAKLQETSRQLGSVRLTEGKASGPCPHIPGMSQLNPHLFPIVLYIQLCAVKHLYTQELVHQDRCRPRFSSKNSAWDSLCQNLMLDHSCSHFPSAAGPDLGGDFGPRQSISLLFGAG